MYKRKMKLQEILINYGPYIMLAMFIITLSIIFISRLLAQ